MMNAVVVFVPRDVAMRADSPLVVTKAMRLTPWISLALTKKPGKIYVLLAGVCLGTGLDSHQLSMSADGKPRRSTRSLVKVRSGPSTIVAPIFDHLDAAPSPTAAKSPNRTLQFRAARARSVKIAATALDSTLPRGAKTSYS